MVLVAGFAAHFCSVYSVHDLTFQVAFYYMWNHYPDSNSRYFREGVVVEQGIVAADIADIRSNPEDIADSAADNIGYTEYFSAEPADIDSFESVQAGKYCGLLPFLNFFFSSEGASAEFRLFFSVESVG